MENKIKPYLLCLGNISKNFTVNNTEKTGLNIYMQMIFLLITILLNISDIRDVQKYLMKKHAQVYQTNFYRFIKFQCIINCRMCIFK